FARIVGRDARLPAFFLPVFLAMNSRPALPDGHNYSRYAAEAEKQTARSFVLHPTPFCSQRTNRNRANQLTTTLNNRFTSRCAMSALLRALRLTLQQVARMKRSV